MLTSLIPVMDASLSDGTEKSHAIHVPVDPEVAKFYSRPKETNFFEMNLWNPLVPFVMGSILANNFGRTCKKVLEEPGLIDRLRAEQYDVYITENFDICGIGIAKAIEVKTVIGSTSTCLLGWQFDEYGVEQALSYRPSLMTSNLDVHSFFSRLWNIYAEWYANRYSFWYPRAAVNRLLKERFGADYPTVAEQSANVAYVFTNSEPLIESAAPTSSRVIDIPGIGARTSKPLDKYWEGVLNLREKAVLLSFGTIVKSIQLSDASKSGILRAFSQFPNVTFIWKYEKPGDDFCTKASKLENVVMTKWTPQVDILNHENLALFITHGGMGSVEESALKAVPGIYIPIFGDQPRNAGMMLFNGLGLVYDKFELKNGDKLAATIKEVLYNKKYAQKAAALSKMLTNKPFTSRELLIKHVEFAAEFGASTALRPQSVDMSFIEYHNVDITAALVVMIIFAIVVVSRVIARIASSFGIRKQKTD